MLLSAALALAQADISTGSIGTTAVETGSIDVSEIDSVDECIVAQICIDRYLWSLYERTRKVDTIKVSEQTKVTVKRKGKTKVVTKTIEKLVDEDFTWKDPDAAKKAGMSPMDYVIGGMDSRFRGTLYHALRALDEAGLMPGITSAFRDDYRQAIAAGQKAQTDRSYHGGSFRGGYGHGLAADIVSVKGKTRTERWTASEQMWKWIDIHDKELGIGRPYLDRDAPHVAPIDGKEYAAHRVQPGTQIAQLKAKKHELVAPHNVAQDAPHVAPIDGKKDAAHRVQPNTRNAQLEAKKQELVAPHKLARDAPHVALIDGKKTDGKKTDGKKDAAHRVQPNTQNAQLKAKKQELAAPRNDHSVSTRPRMERPARAASKHKLVQLDSTLSGCATPACDASTPV